MSDTRITPWTTPGSDEQTIYGDTHWPANEPAGVLICCHGFKGYKDYGFFPTLCDQAAARGLIAVRFNFSHSGMTNRIETFERPGLFEQDRWGRQVEDLQTVFQLADLPADLPCAVFGHSRGGVTSTLFSGRTEPENLAGLITAAAPDYACKMDDLVRDQLRAEGRLLSPSGRTGQDLYVGLGWLEEIERDPAWFDPTLAAANVTCPMLVLHGDADDTVPHTCAKRLHEAAAPHSELAIIPGANHVFNCPNPLPANTPADGLPAVTSELIERSLDFAERCCRTSQA
ncbi:MAG: lysophospholipase [Phycisphaeraceae bacterium]|nr:lysophospholipase [Phycisphaeraceae bacterium]